METELASEREQVKLAILGATNTEQNIDLEELNKNLKQINGIKEQEEITTLPAVVTVNDNEINITEQGEVKEYIKKEWKQISEGITDGEVTIKIGDYIDYNPSLGAKQTEYISEKIHNGYANQIFDVNSYTGKWKVLGFEDGQILITSEDLIGPTSGGKLESGVNCYCLTGQDGVKFGIDELETICKFYANGKFATNGRNLTVDDLNNITGYTPSFEKLSSGAIYDEDMTFSWNGSNVPAFVTKNSVYGDISGTLSKSHKAKGFNWFNNATKSWNNSPFSSVAQVITTLHIDYYYYWISSLNIKQNDPSIGLDPSSVEYKLMFTNSNGNSDGYCYWTSSYFTNGNKDYISYGFYVTEEGLVVGGAPLYYSYGEDELGYYGIKPIIKLSSQIKLTPDGENSFSIAWDENY